MGRDKERRLLRLQNLFRDELSSIIMHDIKDPRVEGAVISRVEVERSLSRAVVYITPSDNQERILEGLDSARGFLHQLLKKRLRLRVIPSLSFSVEDRYFVEEADKPDK